MTRNSFVLLAFTACSLVALPVLAFHPSPAGAQRSPLAEGEPCPSTLYRDRTELFCHCGKTEGDEDVWGTDVYTDDSAICHAALHAGVIGEAGGVVHVRRAPGRASYQGSTRRGVISENYGEWGGSIVFDDPATLAKSLGGVPLCPVLYNAGPEGWSGECRCEDGRVGPVWGTNPYTSDSALCVAALHAGAIGANGGVVRVTAAPGQNSYGGSTRNGVTTSDYGPWGASFRISAAGN